MKMVSYTKESDHSNRYGIPDAIEIEPHGEHFDPSESSEIMYSSFKDYKGKIEDLIFFSAEKTIFLPIQNTIFSLPNKLSHIANAIIESEYILNLQENWDEEGANATNVKTYKKSILFLINYSKYILNEYKQILKEPHIDITRDGSVSIMWDTEIASFLIIFKKNDNEYAYFYGQEKNTKIPFKYAIKIEDEVDKITALWMQKNLK